MPALNYFPHKASFYKGNLHCHSTTSDGKLTYEELKSRYKAKGYSFLCYSDHERYRDMTALNDDDFISLPGVEWSCSQQIDGQWRKTHHVHGIRGTAEMLRAAQSEPLVSDTVLPSLTWSDGPADVSRMSQYLTDRGCFCIYNHPLWSRTRPQDFAALPGYAALEVYNFGCDLESHTGFGDVFWDLLLQDGIRINAVATDDNHNRTNPDDSFGGWIMVNAPALNHDSIVGAILDGTYYSSTGPEIYELTMTDGQIRVRCSPAHHINYIAGNNIGHGFVHWSENDGCDITESSFALRGGESYVRVECVDKLGRVAWSNPFYL